jgi:hypothetical protein
LVFSAFIALSSSGVTLAEPIVADIAAQEAAVPHTIGDPAVTVSPVPMPAKVTVLMKELKASPEMQASRKLKAGKKTTALSAQPVAKSLLSRTERKQMALLAAAPQAGGPLPWHLFDDEDTRYGAEDLDFHRSFSRPQVVKVAGQEDENDDPSISESVKLRLFVARMKALEAHKLASAAAQADDGQALSDEVRLRLFLARAKAVEAHQKKFS